MTGRILSLYLDRGREIIIENIDYHQITGGIMKKMGLYIVVLLSILVLTTCTHRHHIRVAEQSLMPKIAPPVVLQVDSTIIVLADYFRYPGRIDSVMADPSLEVNFSADSSLLVLKPAGGEIPLLSVLTCWGEGYAYSLLVKRSPVIRVPFTFNPHGNHYREVGIAGQMNDWNPDRNPMYFNGTVWETELLLTPGNYQYKLVVDGQWISDPANPDSVSNGIGGYNSLLRTGNLMDANRPFLYTQDATRNTIRVGGVGTTEEVIVFWQNHRLPETSLERDNSSLIIQLPRAASSFERSYIRVWGSTQTDVSNDLLIPLKRGTVITRPDELSRNDKETLILYFMMLDRFRNGNPGNDQPVDDPDVDLRVNYQGGDLKGVIDKLDDLYFTNLGINTLWLSPVTQNPLEAFREYPEPHRKFSGYHGYWPLTLTTVDPRFGTATELKQLVQEAHSRDIGVILDFVSHHVHQDYPLLREHPDWVTQIDLPDGRKNIRLWDEYRLTTWFDIFLPTLNLSKPEVYELVSDSAAYWIGEYRLDGFRHDATKHVPQIFWRTLTRKLDSILEPQGRSIYQIGETFGSRELIRSYINPGMLDAQFDFNLYWEARLAFAATNTSFHDLNVALMQSLSFFGCHHLMGNITGNQDMARFISYAGGALRQGEDDREAGWQRDIKVEDTTGYRRLASLMAFNMTIPGIPVIYYGDEYGMPGANDPDNRRMMQFEGLSGHEQWMLEITKKLAHLRSQHLALLYGDFIPLHVTDKSYAYMRIFLGQAVIVVFNKADSEQQVTFAIPDRFGQGQFIPRFGSSCSLHDLTLSLILPANS
ncbi:MAG: alpha-amylase family glycosyl hydrolase, partial [Bacteroidota bacterium]